MAAPATVPRAPKNDPSTALVAAAPAPAITLLTVRSTLRAGCSALCVLPVGPPPGNLCTGGPGGCADRGGVGRDGLGSSGMAPVHDHDRATRVQPVQRELTTDR